MNVIEWLQLHWVEIVQVITSVIGIASIVVKLTPTLKDDTVLQKIVAFIGKFIALNHTVDPADRPK